MQGVSLSKYYVVASILWIVTTVNYVIYGVMVWISFIGWPHDDEKATMQGELSDVRFVNHKDGY